MIDYFLEGRLWRVSILVNRCGVDLIGEYPQISTLKGEYNEFAATCGQAYKVFLQ